MPTAFRVDGRSHGGTGCKEIPAAAAAEVPTSSGSRSRPRRLAQHRTAGADRSHAVAETLLRQRRRCYCSLRPWRAAVGRFGGRRGAAARRRWRNETPAPLPAARLTRSHAIRIPMAGLGVQHEPAAWSCERGWLRGGTSKDAAYSEAGPHRCGVANITWYHVAEDSVTDARYIDGATAETLPAAGCADLTGRCPRRRRGHGALPRGARARRLLLLRAAQVEQGAGDALQPVVTCPQQLCGFMHQQLHQDSQPGLRAWHGGREVTRTARASLQVVSNDRL